jgi:outer membrane protein assembly factor BamB
MQRKHWFSWFVVPLLSLPLAAQDWTQWRGAQRDGVVSLFTAPARWPAQLKRVWQTPLGAGYSSPLVSGGKVWVQSRQDNDEVVSCLDLKTGKTVWSQRQPMPFKKNQYATSMTGGPFATPLLHNGRLYTLSVNALLTCFDAQSGAVRWRKDFGLPDTSKMFCGTAMSPVIEGANIIVYTGDDLRGGQVMALDAATGKERWTWQGEGPGYASPIVTEFAGVRQFITMSDKSVIALNAANGQLLWRFAWPDEWNENIVTPLRAGELLILSGVRKGTVALRVGKAGAQQVWHNPELTLYMNSPVVDGAHFYGLSNKRKGTFFCAETATGKVVWQTPGREGANAALLQTRALLWFLTSDGQLIVARKTPTAFAEVARYTVAESATYAHPVLLGNSLLVKDEVGVALWRWE